MSDVNTKPASPTSTGISGWKGDDVPGIQPDDMLKPQNTRNTRTIGIWKCRVVRGQIGLQVRASFWGISRLAFSLEGRCGEMADAQDLKFEN